MRSVLSTLVFVLLSLATSAQQSTPLPPDILQISTDPVKPGKLTEYIRVEKEAAQACARASTWPYLAMQAITGPQEVWFVSGFDSYAAMEKSSEPFARNTALVSDLARLMEAKASLVSDPHTIFLRYREDLSRNTGLVRPQTRFFNTTVVKTHPGHEREYEESLRLVRGARESAGTNDNRAVYQVLSGISNNTFIIFSPYHSFRSAAEALDGLLDYDDLDENVRSRMQELQAASVITTETFVFSVNPSMSNPQGEWIADDPGFWRSSPALQRPAPQPEQRQTPKK